jgi:hypothetical protein
MALPLVNESPQYEAVIPSTGKTISFRPFLVKEQKVLMMAYESQDKKQILHAILNTLESCSPQLDVKSLSSFDVDYLFTQIRTKAVGETTLISLECKKCSHKNEVAVNLSEVKLELPERSNIVQLNDRISLKMKWPSYHDIVTNETIISDTATATDIVYETVKMSIDSVLTEEEQLRFKDESPEEVDRFVNSLTTDQFNKINEYLIDAPTMKHTLKCICESCGEDNSKTLEGLNDFFS